MDTLPVTIEKDYFFEPGTNVYIHRSDECEKYIGILHKHKFIEMVYIISGKARHIIDDNEYSVVKGDVSVINCNEAHTFLPEEGYPEPFLAYDLMFTPDFLEKTSLTGEDFSLLADSFLFYSLFPENKDFKSSFNLIEDCGYEIGDIFEKIYEEYSSKKNGYINLIRVYIAEIIIKLLRKIQADKSSLSAVQRELVSKITSFIENNYSIKIKTDELASKLFFNKNYISKLFKQSTGLSIHVFLREIRLKEACRLLKTTQRTITDIASDCGFSDMKTFYSAFKKYKGCTPKQYRENLL